MEKQIITESGVYCEYPVKSGLISVSVSRHSVWSCVIRAGRRFGYGKAFSTVADAVKSYKAQDCIEAIWNAVEFGKTHPEITLIRE